MSALGYQVPPSSFFLSLCIRIFIFLLSLHIDYFSPTLGGLRLHSQEFRLIQNILVSIYPAIWAVPPLFMVIFSLMRRGWLLHPSPFILLVTCAKFAFFPLWYFNFMRLPWLMLVPKVSWCSSPWLTNARPRGPRCILGNNLGSPFKWD